MSTENQSASADDDALFASATSKEVAQPVEEPVAEPIAEEAATDPAPVEPAGEIQPGATEQGGEDRRVPLSELMKERKARQQYEEQLRQAQIRAEILEQQFRLAQQPQQREPEPVPDFIDDPDGFVSYKMRPVLDEFQQFRNAARLEIATLKHGQDKVLAAQEAFDTALARNEITPHEARQVMEAPNPWEAAIQWKSRRDVLSEVGTDPAAYEQKLFQKLMSDPAKRAQLMQGLNAGAAVPPQQPPKTQIQLPTSLRNVGSGLAAKPGAVANNEDDLWEATTTRRTR